MSLEICNVSYSSLIVTTGCIVFGVQVIRLDCCRLYKAAVVAVICLSLANVTLKFLNGRNKVASAPKAHEVQSTVKSRDKSPPPAQVLYAPEEGDIKLGMIPAALHGEVSAYSGNSRKICLYVSSNDKTIVSLKQNKSFKIVAAYWGCGGYGLGENLKFVADDGSVFAFGWGRAE